MSGLRIQLGLPEVKVAKSTAQVKEFDKIIRQRMDWVNRKLRVTAAQASPAEHQPLEGQRMQLFERKGDERKDAAHSLCILSDRVRNQS